MNVRHAAAKVMTELLNQRGSLSSLLPAALADVPARERALLQELCYGTCRWQPRLQCYVDALLDKPLRNKDRDVHALLLIGLHQLSGMRIPAHAAINSTVEAAQALKKPWAKRLLNGTLRRFQREEEALQATIKLRPEFAAAHPTWLVNAIESAWPQQAREIFSANNAHPPFTLRVNRRQTTRESYLAMLNAQQIPARPTAYSADGITLAQAMDVDRLPLFADGAVSVQDEAAQLSARLLDLEPGFSVLDACCAPGGKTAHILEVEPALERLVAVDISAPRIERTRENLRRLGLDAELIVADASETSDWWQGPGFDRILLDAPCSATGVIRRHPDIKILRGPDEVSRLVATQRALLLQLWSLLRPGGILLYATCSILPDENTEVIEHFLGACPDAQHQALTGSWGAAQSAGRQLLPQANGHDGFYFARLRKAP